MTKHTKPPRICLLRSEPDRLRERLLRASECEFKAAINLPDSSGLWGTPDSAGLSDTWTLLRVLMEGWMGGWEGARPPEVTNLSLLSKLWGDPRTEKQPNYGRTETVESNCLTEWWLLQLSALSWAATCQPRGDKTGWMLLRRCWCSSIKWFYVTRSSFQMSLNVDWSTSIKCGNDYRFNGWY